ncbi:putative Glycosyltransferase SypH [Vibrio nigripulchritudo SOn1]|uniref:Glycosyltransferase SypH n=1 Tax=Vibrio nigripulchritudo SOn1 TaxID=1238450 RepID=A0AAV2VIS2_9VIBR|nr:glycosyltransferase family 4 protein [Vibrio nigripulchritudo]CCO44577.1 putative Glycosyltransferase SypH [Vibrio nigripulchritudo SOn1]
MKKRTNPLRVWLTLDSQGFGGIESHVVQLAIGLRQLHCDVSVMFLREYPTPHPMLEKLKEADIPFEFLNGTLSGFYQQAKSQNPDIVHTHGYKAGILARLVSLVTGIPVISTFHAGEIGSGKLRFYDWLDRKTARICKHNFAVSPLIAERFSHSVPVIRNFVSTDDLPFSEGKQIAFVGRLSHEKAPDRFLEMAALDPSTDYHIYGSGLMEEDLKRQSSGNVVFHGHQKDMSKIWSDIGLLVIPSRYEGLPMSALEAMAQGVPVLCTPVGNLSELVINGENGWIKEYANFPVAISDWQNMPRDKKMAIRIAAKRAVEKGFSTQAVIPSILQIYHQHC